MSDKIQKLLANFDESLLPQYRVEERHRKAAREFYKSIKLRLVKKGAIELTAARFAREEWEAQQQSK